MIIRPLWSLSLLLLLTFWTYLPSLDNSFLTLWDDAGYITENPAIWQLNLQSLLWMLSSLHMGNWHPLTWLSHAIDMQLFGLDPWGHHLVNLLWHLANTVLVFLVTQRLLSHIGHEQTLAASAALLSAAIFAVHPQHVESVVWISERKDLLSLFFMLGTFYYYLAYIKHERKTDYLIAIAFAAAATLSKPMAVTLPVLLWIIDGALARKIDKRLFWDKLPFIVLSVGLIAFTLYAQQKAMASLQQIDLNVRLLNGLSNPIFYLQKFIVPTPLVPFYPLYNEITPRLWLSAGATVLFTVLSLLAYRRGFRAVFWAWAFYLISLSPVMGIIQVGSQAAADRYTYLPLLPIYLWLSIGFAKLAHRQYKRIFASALWISMIMVILLFSSASRQQNLIWKNDLVFWSYNTMNDPNSAFSQVFLGHAQRKAGNWDMAALHYEFGAQLSGDPKYFYYWAVARNMLKQGDALLAIYPLIPPIEGAPAASFAKLYAQSVRYLWMNAELTQAAKALSYAQTLAPESKEVLSLQQNLGAYLPKID